MKIRERALAWIIGGAVGLMILYAIISPLLLSPLRTQRDRIAAARENYEKFEHLNSRQDEYRRRLSALASRMYDGDNDKAARLLRDRHAGPGRRQQVG